MRAISEFPIVKILMLLVVVASVFFFQPSFAADVVDRRVHMYSPNVSVTTTYEVDFTIVTPGPVGSMAFEFCDNSPLDNVSCSPPSGFDISAAVLSSQSGETGFSVHSNSTANRLVLSRPVSPAAAIPVSYRLDNIINPDNVGTSFARLYTYATTDGSGTPTDRGGIAMYYNSGIDVSTYVPPRLEFCVAVVISSSDCSSLSGSNIDFGDFSPSTTASATTQMAISTNAFAGYTITAIGTTITSGNNVIPSLTAPTTSSIGVSQFGINLVDNSQPNVGQNVSGLGVGIPMVGFNNVNTFAYSDGAVVARSLRSTDYNKFTVSYIVNIEPNQPPGIYATTISYVALANF